MDRAKTSVSQSTLRRVSSFMDDFDNWMNGSCADYAAALLQLEPHLNVGLEYADNQPYHAFLHDEKYAYDYAGRHKLPYLRNHNGQIKLELNIEDLNDLLGVLPDGVDDAIEYLIRPIKLYHGTTTEAIKNIKAKGLKQACLTNDRQLALYYASAAADETSGEADYIELEIPYYKLSADEAAISEPISIGVAAEETKLLGKRTGLSFEEAVWARANNFGEICGNNWSDLPAAASLEVCNSVIYKKL